MRRSACSEPVVEPRRSSLAIVHRRFSSPALEFGQPSLDGCQPVFKVGETGSHYASPISLRREGTNLLINQNNTKGVAITVSVPNRPSLKVSRLCGMIGM